MTDALDVALDRTLVAVSVLSRLYTERVLERDFISELPDDPSSDWETAWELISALPVMRKLFLDQDSASTAVPRRPRTSEKPENPNAAPPVSRLAESSGNDDETRRLVRLVWVAHKHLKSADGMARFPDPLRLAVKFMTPARYPTLRGIAEHVGARRLARLYSESYDSESVDRLRQALDLLGRRLAKPLAYVGAGAEGVPESTLHFAADCLCLGGWCQRAGKLGAYVRLLDDFLGNPGELGIGHGAAGALSARRDQYELMEAESHALSLAERRPLPGLSEVTRYLYAQPTGLPGLDAVLGGLLQPLPPKRQTEAPGTDAPTTKSGREGTITLLCGRPGSGKTSLAIALAVRLAELGIRTGFAAVEEADAYVASRVSASGAQLWPAFAHIVLPPHESKQGHNFDSRIKFTQLSTSATFDFPDTDDARMANGDRIPQAFFIDSFTMLLRQAISLTNQSGEVSAGGRRDSRDREPPPNRGSELSAAGIKSQGSEIGATGPTVCQSDATGKSGDARVFLADALAEFRKRCDYIFLIGTRDDVYHADTGYLVDNVVSLDLAFTETGETHRSLTVEKTRQQLSSVGQHSLAVNGYCDVSVYPSLTNWLDVAARRHDIDPDDSHAVPVALIGDSLISLKDNAHSLLFGPGSASKAKFALSLALAQSVPIPKLNARSAALWDYGVAIARHPRVLVVSFLYDHRYYERAAESVRQPRLAKGWHDRPEKPKLADQLDVYTVVPGPIDPTVVIYEVDSRLRSATLLGQPFTAVVIDGVHNLLVQFPRLDASKLFLPTLLRLLRSMPVSVFVTFTQFAMQHFVDPKYPTVGAQVPGIEHLTDAPGDSGVAQHLFYHLLVSRIDYSFLLERSFAADRQRVRVALTQSIGDDPVPSYFSWTPGERDGVVHPTDPRGEVLELPLGTSP